MYTVSNCNSTGTTPIYRREYRNAIIHVFSTFGYCSNLISDQGCDLASNPGREFMKILKVQHACSTIAHSMVILKNNNGTIKRLFEGFSGQLSKTKTGFSIRSIELQMKD